MPPRTAMPTPAQAVNDIADQVQRFAFGVFQEVEQGVRLATRCAQVQIRDPEGAVFLQRLYLFFGEVVRFGSLVAPGAKGGVVVVHESEN